MGEMRDGSGREDWREARSDGEGRIERGCRQRGEGQDGGGGRGMEAEAEGMIGSVGGGSDGGRVELEQETRGMLASTKNRS